ncbi:predicted protein [Nematostella vectensis]|uniref:Bms1-type G domain-containing protein n=1 Tax=Nematostella vectensis TaxID=45351 RepID=A7S8M5_NEMVE|nr:predicted protein [Nematostella vectensis]|eukprot:XP_001632030.1 predicted protein [Nematostella vectensis]
MADDESGPSKAHRKRHSGPKADKKKKRSDGKDTSIAHRNPKAFAVQSVVKAARNFRRTQDVQTKKHHIPVVDRTPLEPPPVVVAVVGPPKVGKTTLINSLLKNFTRQHLSDIQGPVTLVSGKKRRLTLLECANDINSMIDVAKVADLVLLLIDASFGFEMEVFEFLNICQVHGFPKIMGVLTHLDLLRNNKSLRKIKKRLKNRFWTEVYQGAKLFNLSGLIHGSYPKVEVHNLGRFISVMRFRPLTWRTSHPYILADRMEDLTDPEKVRQDSKCDRKVSLYGYVRGAHLKYNTKVHLIGCGDFPLDDVSLLRDPCPLPDKEKKRSLNEKEKLLYAPMSGIGGIVYDKDAVYIDLGGSHSSRAQPVEDDEENGTRPGSELVTSLIDTKHTLDTKMASSQLTLFKARYCTDSAPVGVEDISDRLRWKENLWEKARDSFYRHQDTTPNLRRLVYGEAARETPRPVDDEGSDDDDVIGGFFKVKAKKKNKVHDMLQERDCSLATEAGTVGLGLEELGASIRDCFVTGKWKEEEDAERLLSLDDQLSDEEMFGDFEDLETGEVHQGEEDTGLEDSAKDTGNDKQDDEENKKALIEKKKKLKAAFNAQYDEGDETSFYEELKAQMSEQTQLNQREFEDMDDETRVQYEGFRPGMYVRLEINNMPSEFVTNFDPRFPVILGGLLANEDTLGYSQVRIKKHRWFKRILKTRDPLVVSVGWRRYQTIALYSMQDHNGRHRLLKYTPEHLHCISTMYGPIAPPGTGLLAVQCVSGNTPDFRIAATGTVLQLDKSVEIVKKLKLTGTPYKIYKNTAFIKGMFNSALEVAKFEGATIRSVSGIRGQIKRALKSPEGGFRATFEDKLLISDIVFVRTWYPVTVPKYYNPVTTLLLPTEQKTGWEGMKTVGQLRKDQGLNVPVKQDSIYKPVERQTRRFNPLVIPKKLQKDLPFKSKPKDAKKRQRPSLESKRAVVMEPQEKKVYSLMQQLYTANKEKLRKRKEKLVQKRKVHRAEQAKIDSKRQTKRREERKKVFRMMAQAEKRKSRTGKR